MHFDEEKFTAYALGELSPSDLGPIEAQLRYDDAARQFVADVRSAAGWLTQSLQQDTAHTLTVAQHAAIERQLRANRAASTGTSAASVASPVARIEPSAEAEISLKTMATDRAPRVSDDVASGAPSIASLQAQALPRSERSRIARHDSIFTRRARRYDRAVLSLSLAASVAIVCLGLAALLLVLKDHRQVATNVSEPHGPPNLVQEHALPPEINDPGEAAVDPSLDPQGEFPLKRTPMSSITRQSPTTIDDVAPLLAEFGRHPFTPLVADDTHRPPVIPLPASEMAGESTTGPLQSLHLSRAGLVRGAADLPRVESAAAPRLNPAAQSYSSINPAHGAPLTASVAVTKVDPALDLTRFEPYHENPLVLAAVQPFSSFAPNTDDASYPLIRRFVAHGFFPPPQAVRVEEMLNYFAWNTPVPTNPDAAFATSIEVGACPWNVSHRLARISLKARDFAPGRRPPVNLVVLVDLSAPMQADDKLPLLKKSLKLLLGQLGPRDHLSIVGAAQTGGTFLPPTSGDDHRTILSAIDRLNAAGPAGRAPGIETAYYTAAGAFTPGGVNRVLLATDGSWSAAVADTTSITRMIRDEARAQNISLGVLAMAGPPPGVEALLRRLAAAGNGSYLSISSLAEARETLVDQADGSLVEVARDVSVRVEFEPATTESYRLIGYESHLLPAADFDDAVVGGVSIGAGHDTTALYEIVPTAASRPAGAPAAPLLTVSVHYTDPATQSPALLKFAASDRPVAPSKVSNDFKFAAAIAECAMLLRDTPHGIATWSSVIDLAKQGRGPDEAGYRADFIEMARHAKAIAARG